MAGVFVSYAREDVAKAKAIARELEGASFDVWFDERIHSGSEFSREIEQALAGSAAVVVLWSAHSVNSPWVRDEAAEGRDSGRLVPVLRRRIRRIEADRPTTELCSVRESMLGGVPSGRLPIEWVSQGRRPWSLGSRCRATERL